MKRLMTWLFGLPTLLVLLLFALANRHLVRVTLDPLMPEDPWLALDLPLWLVFYAGILLGMLVGGLVAWVRQSKWRRRARHFQRELEEERARTRQLRRQLEALREARQPLPAPDAASAGSSATVTELPRLAAGE